MCDIPGDRGEEFVAVTAVAPPEVHLRVLEALESAKSVFGVPRVS
jgi:hypothetical protein